MRKIRDWSAIRSGKTMTVSGLDACTGKPVKVTHVTAITGKGGQTIARTATEEIYLGAD